MQTDTIQQGEAAHIWLLAADAFPDAERESRQRAARFMGAVAVRGQLGIETVEALDSSPNDSTLLAALQEASLGDRASLEVVRTNVTTDVAERMFKAGHQTEVALKVQDGILVQNGRAMHDIHRNTLEHTTLNQVMLRRTTAELRNVFLFEQLITAGVLDTHDAVVFSPCPADAKTKRDYGFFGGTDTCSVQLLSVADGEAVLQTALVAGKRSPDSKRHDVAAIKGLAAMHGVDLAADEADEFIKYVMLVPKGGDITNVVAGYDQAAGGTFYGQALPVRDYKAYAAECQRRSDSFGPTVDAITTQLLHEAHAFDSPLDAIMRLDELSERYCVRRAVEDDTLDAAVFGAESAAYIDEARELYRHGDLEAGNQALQKALDTADSSSCPLFKDEAQERADGTSSDRTSSSTEGNGKKKWMNCPHCKAKVFDDPCARVLSCYECKATVVNGRARSDGNGGKAKREEAGKPFGRARQAVEKPAAEQSPEIEPTTEAAPTAPSQVKQPVSV